VRHRAVVLMDVEHVESGYARVICRLHRARLAR
jgi:hypothetical protein